MSKGKGINQPLHHLQHPSSTQHIQIAEYISSCLGNAIKYLWHHEHKGNAIKS